MITEINYIRLLHTKSTVILLFVIVVLKQLVSDATSGGSLNQGQRIFTSVFPVVSFCHIKQCCMDTLYTVCVPVRCFNRSTCCPTCCPTCCTTGSPTC